MKLGRKTISKDGEKMKNRNFRTTDVQWADCLSFGGGNWIRNKIRLEKSEQNNSLSINDVKYLIVRLEKIVELVNKNEYNMAIAKLLADISALRNISEEK